MKKFNVFVLVGAAFWLGWGIRAAKAEEDRLNLVRESNSSNNES